MEVSCLGGRFFVMLHNGEERSCLLEKPLFEGFRTDVLHTVRIEFAPEETRFLIDLMQQGTAGPLEAKGAISDTEIKFENTINRFTAVANPRQIERVISGAVFPLEIIYNMDDDKMEEDFQTLKDAFILLQYDYLGGHGSRGYGRVEIQALDIQVCVGTVEDKLLETCRNLLKEV